MQPALKDIPGFPGYQVGDDGSVWTMMRFGPLANRRPGTLRPLRMKLTKLGYLSVCLRRNGRSFTRFVHRLVLEAFVGPCPDGMEALHWPDRTQTNCSLVNLRWGTHVENYADSVRHGTHIHGSAHPVAKLSESDIPQIRLLLAEGNTLKGVAARFRVSHVTIANIRDIKIWNHV